jgi:Imidazolonepropionase and related amidohydrolases
LRCGRELTLPKLLKQNGVKMLAGSDTAVIANWCIPGFSLHQEFALLAASGLSPLEILQMTTLNGAQFLGREATMGTVDQGKNADLVLLDANPIADVANLDKISAVFLKDKYYSRVALDKLLSDVAAAYAAQPLKDSTAWIRLTSCDRSVVASGPYGPFAHDVARGECEI